MFSVDLHVHSRFFHGFGARPTAFDPIGARAVGILARRRGLDAVAFTNHDYAWLPGECAVTAVPGIELSTTDGHVLVVGPDPPAVADRGAPTTEEAVELAHDRGCAAIMAHPFRNGDPPAPDADFDAVEINGKSPGNRSRVEALAAKLDLPLVGGSDAHYPFEVGRAYTRLLTEDRSPAGVAAAIRDGGVEPVQATGTVDRLLGPAYRAIHRYKRGV